MMMSYLSETLNKFDIYDIIIIIIMMMSYLSETLNKLTRFQEMTDIIIP
jgi:hypothetical protein